MTIEKLIKYMILFYLTLIVIVSVSVYNLMSNGIKINNLYEEDLNIVSKPENTMNTSIHLPKLYHDHNEIAELKSLIKKNIIFIYAVMLIAVISFFFSYNILKRRILNPVCELNRIITSSHQGSESIEEIAVNNDEIGRMIKEFFIMQKTLRNDYISLEEVASKDSLTGVLNRRAFFDISDKLFKLSVRNKSYLSLLILDIDFFKKINDTYGDIVGDDVLKYLVRNIEKEIRETDVFARFGGEEFIVLLPNTDENGAFLLAEKIREHTENNPYKDDGLSIPMTVSIGVSQLQDEKLLRELISRADDALYQAKKCGRNKIQIT